MLPTNHRAIKTALSTENGKAWVMRAKDPIEGYVRCDTLMPLLGAAVSPIREMPTRRALGLLTEDGSLSLGLTAESAQELAELLTQAAAEMRAQS